MRKSVVTGLPVEIRKQTVTNRPIVVKTTTLGSVKHHKSDNAKSFVSNMMRYVDKDTLNRASFGQTAKRKRNLNHSKNYNDAKRMKMNSIEILKNQLRLCMLKLEAYRKG